MTRFVKALTPLVTVALVIRTEVVKPRLVGDCCLAPAGGQSDHPEKERLDEDRGVEKSIGLILRREDLGGDSVDRAGRSPATASA